MPLYWKMMSFMRCLLCGARRKGELRQPTSDPARGLGDQRHQLVDVDDGQARGVEDERQGRPRAPVVLEDGRGHGRQLRFQLADGDVVAGLADGGEVAPELAP